jgi:multicomponent Na+:H+ antiporter subunit C
MAILIGVLTSVGVYLMLHRTLTRIVLGVGMLGNAVNLMIIASGGPPGEAPIIGRDGPFADPVPQALVLTAIVIGFSIISILLAVAYRSWTIDGNDEVEDDISDRQMASVRDPSDFVDEPGDQYSQEELL